MASEPYTPFATVNPTGPSGAMLHVDASPEMAAGVGIGQAEQKLGATLGQAGQTATKAALAQQQLTNELYANDANSKTAGQLTQLYTEYSKLQGRNAVEGLGDYQDKVRSAVEGAISAAPNDHARAMLSQSLRYIGDSYLRYGAFQSDREWKSWQTASRVDGMTAFANQAALAINDPPTMDKFVASGADQARALAEQQGLSADEQNGAVAKYIGKTAIQLALLKAQNGDIKGASELVERYRPHMDAGSQVEAFQKLKPLLLADKANTETTRYLTEGQGDAPPSFSTANNVGNLRASPTSFQSFDTPEDGVAATVNNLRDNYRGLTLAQIGDKWAPPSENAKGVWAQNVASASGLPLDQSPNLDDPATLQKLVKGISIAEKSKGDAGIFTQAVISTGVGNALSGMKPRTAAKMDESQILARVNADYAGDPELRDKIHTNLMRQFSVQNMALTAQAQAQKDGQEKAANGYVTRMMKGDTGPQIIEDIANDTNLDATAKAHLWSMAETHSKSDLNRDTKTYGPGFYTLFQQAHLPDGDPNRLTDQSQLYGHVGPNGDLTLSGFDRLTQELAGKRTVDGAAEGEMKKQFLANAKQQLSGQDPLLHIRDPKGEELYLKFMGQFFPAYDKAKAEGKSPAALLNPDSPDYLGKAIAGFRRAPAQFMKDLIEGGSDVSAQTMAEPDLSTPEGVKALYPTDPQRATQIAIEKGWIQAPAKVAQPSPPIR